MMALGAGAQTEQEVTINYGEIGHDISPLALNIITSFILTTTESE